MLSTVLVYTNEIMITSLEKKFHRNKYTAIELWKKKIKQILCCAETSHKEKQSRDD